MLSYNDVTFAKLAYKHKMINKDEFRESLCYLVELERKYKKISIDRILFLCGFLTEEQITKIQSEQKRKIYFCNGCLTKLNVWTLKTSQIIACPKCNTKFQIPEGLFTDDEKKLFEEIKQEIERIKHRYTSTEGVLEQYLKKAKAEKEKSGTQIAKAIATEKNN